MRSSKTGGIVNVSTGYDPEINVNENKSKGKAQKAKPPAQGRYIDENTQPAEPKTINQYVTGKNPERQPEGKYIENPVASPSPHKSPSKSPLKSPRNRPATTDETLLALNPDERLRRAKKAGITIRAHLDTQKKVKLEEEIKELTQDSKVGNARSQLRLAFLYENGIGVDEDLERAIQLYNLALASPLQHLANKADRDLMKLYIERHKELSNETLMGGIIHCLDKKENDNASPTILALTLELGKRAQMGNDEAHQFLSMIDEATRQ